MLDLSDRLELEWLAQLVADVRAAAPGIEPLLVGALARDLLLHYGHGFKIERATADVDFALAVANWEQFSAVRAALLASGLFSPYRNTAQKLQHSKFGPLDLIPFGAVERSDGTIAWPPAGDEVMAVIGYAEAAAGAMTLALPKHQKARVVSLPMLAVLKIPHFKEPSPPIGIQPAAARSPSVALRLHPPQVLTWPYPRRRIPAQRIMPVAPLLVSHVAPRTPVPLGVAGGAYTQPPEHSPHAGYLEGDRTILWAALSAESRPLVEAT